MAVIDDNPAAGGQIWRGAVVHDSTAVIDGQGGGGPLMIRTRSPAGVRAWSPRGIVLATGARERFLPFPG